MTDYSQFEKTVDELHTEGKKLEELLGEIHRISDMEPKSSQTTGFETKIPIIEGIEKIMVMQGKKSKLKYENMIRECKTYIENLKERLVEIHRISAMPRL